MNSMARRTETAAHGVADPSMPHGPDRSVGPSVARRCEPIPERLNYPSCPAQFRRLAPPVLVRRCRVPERREKTLAVTA